MWQSLVHYCFQSSCQSSAAALYEVIKRIVDSSCVHVSVCLHSGTVRNAFVLLLVATSTWLCGLMAVNNSILAFYYIFDVLCVVQVWTKCFMFCFVFLLPWQRHPSKRNQEQHFLFLFVSQGLTVMLVFTVFNSEVQEAWRVACLGKKSPAEDPPRPPQNTVSQSNLNIWNSATTAALDW